MGAYGDLWGSLETYGDLWGPMQAYGDLWGPLLFIMARPDIKTCPWNVSGRT